MNPSDCIIYQKTTQLKTKLVLEILLKQLRRNPSKTILMSGGRLETLRSMTCGLENTRQMEMAYPKNNERNG
ncbi:hypothetical protein EL22_25520 [Halostagnicola sp. A56]|nr:hypothetical protein EL22_25520 [Halostagnicola sp. A56]